MKAKNPKMSQVEQKYKILTVSELTQAGDIFLLRFICPSCNTEQFEGYPLKSCSKCEKDLTLYILNLPSKTRLLVGSRRKTRQRIGKRIIRALFDLCEGKCGYCQTPFSGEEYQVEHIVPVSVGGTNDFPNLILACKRCNSVAGSKCFNSFEIKREYILNRRAELE